MDDNNSVMCSVCLYPSRVNGVCDNPACEADKPQSQLDLINAARAEQKRKDDYIKRRKGIDYSLSFKRKGA